VCDFLQIFQYNNGKHVGWYKITQFARIITWTKTRPSHSSITNRGSVPVVRQRILRLTIMSDKVVLRFFVVLFYNPCIDYLLNSSMKRVIKMICSSSSFPK